MLCAQKMSNWPKNEFYNNLVSLGAGSCIDAQQLFEIMIAPFSPSRSEIWEFSTYSDKSQQMSFQTAINHKTV